MKSTLILIPTYNEAENIVHLLPEIERHVPGAEILVIDDSSTDGTADKVNAVRESNPRVHLLSRKGKLGLASAYLDGMAWGLARCFQQMVQMDADFSHRPADLVPLLEALETGDAALGCRYINGGTTEGWSRMRRGISRAGNFYAKTVLNLPYRDMTGGYNAWNRRVLAEILDPPVRSRGYAFQIELKCRAHDMGFQLCEVPIRFEERRAGKSKISSNILVEAILRVPTLRWHFSASSPAASVPENT